MLRRFLLAYIITVATCFAGEYEGHHLGINTGASTTKNFLGGFYSWDRNQVNVGTNLIFFTFEEGVFFAQPSISYNRYLTAAGLYTSIGVMTTYKPESHDTLAAPIAPDTVGKWSTIHDPDWRTTYLTLGIGKTFQFKHWGVNIDANLITPMKQSFAKEWGLWLGAGASYRFNLD